MTNMQSLRARIGVVAGTLKRIALRVLVVLFGTWHWQAPSWLLWSRRQSTRGWQFATAGRSRVATVVITILAVAAGVAWYVTRPTPHYVPYTVTPPGLTEY